MARLDGVVLGWRSTVQDVQNIHAAFEGRVVWDLFAALVDKYGLRTILDHPTEERVIQAYFHPDTARVDFTVTYGLPGGTQESFTFRPMFWSEVARRVLGQRKKRQKGIYVHARWNRSRAPARQRLYIRVPHK